MAGWQATGLWPVVHAGVLGALHDLICKSTPLAPVLAHNFMDGCLPDP